MGGRGALKLFRSPSPSSPLRLRPGILSSHPSSSFQRVGTEVKAWLRRRIYTYSPGLPGCHSQPFFCQEGGKRPLLFPLSFFHLAQKNRNKLGKERRQKWFSFGMNKSDLHSGMGEFHAPGMASLVCPQPSPHPTGEEREKAKVKQMLQRPNGGGGGEGEGESCRRHSG